ncbi:MAG: NAD(P)/FAD-dependent oxidoreductase [Pseudomonadota bacterium]
MIREGRITILGAGLTGALLAVLLARRGIEVTVLERQTDPRMGTVTAGRSINLAMAARGMRGLKRAGLEHAIDDLLCPMPGRMLHPIAGGLEFQRYSGNEKDINYSVSRAGLNNRLIDAAERAGATIRFGARCEQYDPATGTLHLLNPDGSGDTYRAERLIAADGAGSPTRRALAHLPGFEASEQLLGHRYQEIDIPAAADGGYAMDAEALHIWPRGGYMLIALPNPGGDFTATLFMAEDDAAGTPSFSLWETPGAAEAFVATQFPDVPPLVPDLANQLDAHPLGILGNVRCKPWHIEDRVLLIGDAAHAIVPFHGQGMNAAFEDCVVLDRLLDDHDDWGRVFQAFSDVRLVDADAIATMAMENYVEMRDTVRDPRFHLKKTLAFALEQRAPEHFIPRYSMVMFHAYISYATALERGRVQAALLERWTESADSLDEIDLDRCLVELGEALAPIPRASV